MLRKYFQVLLLISICMNCSCKKIIDLNLEDGGQQLIIEGDVTNQRGIQVVKISRSLAVSARNDFPAVSGALVKVTDNMGNVLNYSETSPGTYAVFNVSGKPGRTYTLEVKVDGQTYTAISTMPEPVKLDSLTATEETFGKEKRTLVAVNYTDPMKVPNYYLFKMAVNGVNVERIFSESDFFTDGRPVKKDLYLTSNDNVKIEQRDNVAVEMQCIDLATFTYWRSLEQQYASGNPNDVTTPSNPPNNLNNKALGYFSAHTTEFMNVVIAQR
ncbi:MAG: hypothetical protein JWQ28_1980 [Pedobacter sp.]|jgi:hypothetical protein|nr:hypothetical protein [Pedobacter sp.]